MACARRSCASVLFLAFLLASCGDDAAPKPAVPVWAKVAPEQIAEAEKYGVPVAFENDLGMRFVLIPAGTFLMGSPEEEARERGYAPVWVPEWPRHEVTLPRPYYLQVSEVRNRDVRAWKPNHMNGVAPDWPSDLDDQPALTHDYGTATGFAKWLTERDARRTYRLPTEAEWEYACRAGTTTRFWWGDSEEVGWKYANANDPVTREADGNAWPGWPADDGHRGPAPVCSYPANAWGLHDMLGNVWEHCSDLLSWYEQAKTTDPRGPARTCWSGHVVRGGSWRDPPEWIRCAHRGDRNELPRWNVFGFRLVSPLPGHSAAGREFE